VTPVQESAAANRVSATVSAKKPPSAAALMIGELDASLDPGKKCQLIKDLGKHRGDEVLQALVRSLKDPDEKVRLCAVATLQDLGDARAVEPLIELLVTDTAHQPCYYATKALARFKTPRAIAGMVSALERRKGDLSELALQLGEVRAREAVDALVGALADSDRERVSAYARRHAVMALEKIGDRRAVPSLRLALSDDDGGVRERAQSALLALGESRMPFVHTSGHIVHYQTMEDANHAFEIALGALQAAPQFHYDIAITEMEETWALIVTADKSESWYNFLEELQPRLGGENLEFSTGEEKLSRFVGAAGKLVKHQQLR